MSEKIQIEVPAHVSRLLTLLLATDDLPDLQLPQMDSVKIDEDDITNIFEEIRFEDTSAKIVTRLSQENHEKFEQYAGKPLGQSCGSVIECRAGDFLLRAHKPSIAGHGNNFSFDGQGGGFRQATCTVHAINWEISSTVARVGIWVCETEIPKAFRATRGNLRLQQAEKRLSGYFLRGAYDYYLLPRLQKLSIFVVPRENAEFTREKFAFDIMAMSFVFGEQINISRIFGFGPDGMPIAEFGGLITAAPTEEGWITEPFPTVMTDDPQLLLQSEFWMAPFFRCLSEVLHSKPSVRLDYAIDAFLDTLKPHIIASYLRLQVILESFSYWLLKEKNLAREGLTKSSDEWEKWVKRDLKEKIHSLALDDYKEELYLSVKGAYKHISGRRVQDAFRLFEIGWTDRMKAEIKLRNDVVHMMELSKRRDGKIDAEDLMPRLRLLQVMLIALIARSVGYGGMIRYWKSGPQQEAGWWPLDEVQRREALQFFVAQG